MRDHGDRGTPSSTHPDDSAGLSWLAALCTPVPRLRAVTYLDEKAAEIRGEVPEELIPQDSDDLFRIYAVLMRAKGADVSPVDVHDAWVVWMQIRQPDHSALAPYETLDSETQDKDRPFVQAIRRVASREAR